jgi:hypothetical protein
MTGHVDAIAEAARLLKPRLADEQVVKRVRFSVKSQRDCGGANRRPETESGPVWIGSPVRIDPYRAAIRTGPQTYFYLWKRTGMRDVHGHVSLEMRANLKDALQQRWEISLHERARLMSGSPVRLLDALLTEIGPAIPR